MNFAKFFLNETVTDIPLSTTQGDPITSGISWMPKGIYRFNGVDYDCTVAGKYTFWDNSTQTAHNRLVYAYPYAVEPDLYGFLSGFSWNHVHGSEDHNKSGQTLAESGHNHKWRLKCGPTVDLARWFLSYKYGYATRQINLSTLEPQWGVLNGHIVFEVWDENKWKLWDISNSRYFMKDGVHLSADEIISEGVMNCDHIMIDSDEKRGASVDNGWCSQTFHDIYILPDPSAWFERIYQDWSVG